MDASHFTALVKAPRYRGGGEAPAKVPLPQAVPRKGFVIAGTETPRKVAASVERGPREWYDNPRTLFQGEVKFLTGGIRSPKQPSFI